MLTADLKNIKALEDDFFIIDTLKTYLTELAKIHTQTILIAIAAAFGILLILGIVIIWNQHKIKKMLRELQEQKTEDKP